jgi:hypothetical protein
VNNPEFTSYKQFTSILKCSALCEILWAQKGEIQKDVQKELKHALSTLTSFVLDDSHVEFFRKEKIAPLMHILIFQLKLFDKAYFENLRDHVLVCSLLEFCFTHIYMQSSVNIPGWQPRMYYALCAASMEYPFQLVEIAKLSLDSLFSLVKDCKAIEEADLKFILMGIQSLFMLYDNNELKILLNLEAVLSRLMHLNFSYPIEQSKFIVSSIWNRAVGLFYKKLKVECKQWIQLALSMHALLLKNLFPQQAEMMRKALEELGR